MTLFWELLPLYVFGNFHCLGMCGPLVAFLGKSPYRSWYLWGRILSFSLMGMVSAWLGIFFSGLFERAQIGFILPLVVGGFMIFLAVGKKRVMPTWLEKGMERSSLLLLKGGAGATMLFGATSVLLPCGQSAIVFSACALAATKWEGMLNGFALASFTTPALFFSMEGFRRIHRWRALSEGMISSIGVVIGLLSCFRAFAEVGWISHLSIPIFGSHLVLW